jgi:type IV secretory pathway VirB10-like protein
VNCRSAQARLHYTNALFLVSSKPHFRVTEEKPLRNLCVFGVLAVILFKQFLTAKASILPRSRRGKNCSPRRFQIKQLLVEEEMPKDPANNIDRFKIEGGELNEYEFQSNQEEFSEPEPPSETPENLIPGTPPEISVPEVVSRAHEVVQRRAKKRVATTKKAAAKKATSKKSTGKKKSASTKKSASRKSSTKKVSKSKGATKKAGKKAGKKTAKKAGKKAVKKAGKRRAIRGLRRL